MDPSFVEFVVTSEYNSKFKLEIPALHRALNTCPSESGTLQSLTATAHYRAHSRRVGHRTGELRSLKSSSFTADQNPDADSLQDF